MFNFNTTPRLVIGASRLQFLGRILSDLNVRNPLIVTGPNLVKTDIVIEAQKWSWSEHVFYDLVQDPTTQNVLDCVEYGISKDIAANTLPLAPR